MRLPWERRKLADVPLSSVPRVYRPRPPSSPRRKSTAVGMSMDHDTPSFSITPSTSTPLVLRQRSPSPCHRLCTPLGLFSQCDMLSHPIVAPKYVPRVVEPPRSVPVVVEPPPPVPGSRAAKLQAFIKTHFKK